MRARVLRWLAWAFGLAMAYLVVAPFVLALMLGALLTEGFVDWAGYSRTPPAEPTTIGYRGDPTEAFGYAFETVSYATDLGNAEAWVIPTAEPSKLWAIWVHGIGGLRENGYRLIQTLHEQGLPVLAMTYRNDRGAPRSPDGLYSFGLTEWKDLEAAVSYARGRGAEQVVIVAESMGAAITGQYLANAQDTSIVAGLALDAPALDFSAIIHAGGSRYWVPLADVVATAGLEVSALLRRDLRQAVSLDAVAAFGGPIFLAHGSRDPLVPFSISERLVAKRPDVVFVRTDADKHPLSYDAEPDRYTAGLVEWLQMVRGQSAL